MDKGYEKVRVEMNKKRLIQELKKIRVRLTTIYIELGNPANKNADMVLSKDIVKWENEQ